MDGTLNRLERLKERGWSRDDRMGKVEGPLSEAGGDVAEAKRRSAGARKRLGGAWFHLRRGADRMRRAGILFCENNPNPT
jgi:hypothetical protein